MAEEMTLVRRAALLIVLGTGWIQAADAERFRFLPTTPKWLTASIDLRDASGVLWPTLIGGRNAGGELRLDEDGLAGAFTVRCDQHSQIDGDQSRRVLGDLVRDKPPVELAIASIRSPKVRLSAEAELARATGDGAARPEPPKQVVLVGTLALLGRKLPVEIPAEVRRVDERLMLSATWTIEGATLGLRPAQVAITLTATGYRHPDDLKPTTSGPSLELELTP